MLSRVLRNQLKCWWTGKQWKLRLNITYTIQTLSLVSRHYCSSKKNYIYKKVAYSMLSICTSKVRRLHNNGLQPGHSFSLIDCYFWDTRQERAIKMEALELVSVIGNISRIIGRNACLLKLQWTASHFG